MTKNKPTLDQYDLSHVRQVFTGAAPLGKETAADLSKLFPSWHVRQGYGMCSSDLKETAAYSLLLMPLGLTECSTVTCSQAFHDIDPGSCGSLLPGVEAKLLTIEGVEITGYDQPGEICFKSPSNTLGYLNNEKSTKETFIDGWVRTGDEAVIRKSPNGYEHVWIVDRIKELIKVKVSLEIST